MMRSSSTTADVSAPPTPRVLVVSLDTASAGGVASFVGTLLENFSSSEHYRHLALSSGNAIVSKILNAILDSFRLIATCVRHRIECVHVNPSLNPKALFRDGLFVLTVLLFRLGRPVVFFHGWDPATEGRIRNNAFWRFLFTRIFGKAAMTLVLASAFREALLEIGFDPDRVRVITTMFDGRLIEKPESGTPGKVRNVLFLSRFVREKGVFEVLDAFSRISARYPERRLVLAGDGPEYEPLKRRVAELGLEERVELPGYLVGRAKSEALKDADLFVFPTYYGEGCPVALLEAMAAGHAVVTTPVGGLVDIFRDGDNGVLLQEVSVDTVAQAMDALLADDRQREEIGRRNARYAWQSFEARVVTARIEDIYAEVV